MLESDPVCRKDTLKYSEWWDVTLPSYLPKVQKKKKFFVLFLHFSVSLKLVAKKKTWWERQKLSTEVIHSPERETTAFLQIQQTLENSLCSAWTAGRFFLIQPPHDGTKSTDQSPYLPIHKGQCSQTTIIWRRSLKVSFLGRTSSDGP